MPSSLLNPLAPAPQVIEQLPAYTRRDPETSSIHSSRSAAPSYVSEAPTYHSTVPSSVAPQASAERTGLPPIAYAPGFFHGRLGVAGDVSHLKFNISEWSAVRRGTQTRQYQNVALRRAKVASMDEHVRTVAGIPAPGRWESFSSRRPDPLIASPTISAGSSIMITNNVREGQAEASSSVQREVQTPLSPLEDPELVGAEAAEQARQRRLYLEACLVDQREALTSDGKSWDFMVTQMRDWERQERSWDRFQRDVRKGKVLGRLLR